MTSTINFTDLKQKMILLKEMNQEFEQPTAVFGSARHKRYIELRKEVTRILAPLFEDLNETGMMLLWTKPTPNSLSRIDELVFNGENSGLEMSVKEMMSKFCLLL